MTGGSHTGSSNQSTHIGSQSPPTSSSTTTASPKQMKYPTNPRYPSVDHDEIVKETHRINIDYNPVSGRKTLNTYEIIRELGRGEHGKVKLGYDRERDIYAAIKLLDRKEKPRLGRPQGSSTEEKIHREIAILKKCRHPNIVRLLEVLDDESSRKVYLVLEFCSKGEIQWQTPRGEPALNRQQARSVAQNVSLGLEYLHLNGIIHRDIKPANLLVSQDNIVKISDFGVSYAVKQDASVKSELELSKTVGTPAFFSPELCIPTEFNDNGERKTPQINSKVDVWAYGVTLFCLLYGRLPFEADNEYELFRVIATEEPQMPDPNGDEDLVLANDLVKKLLTKDPEKRMTIAEAKHHPWMLKGLNPQQQAEFLNIKKSSAIKVSNEEVDQAIKGASIKTRIKQGFSRIVDQMIPRSARKDRSNSSSSSVNQPAVRKSSEVSSISSIGSGKSHKAQSTTNLELNKSKHTTPAFRNTSASSSTGHLPHNRISIPKGHNQPIYDESLNESTASLGSVASIISSNGSGSSSPSETTTPIGLMPMHLPDSVAEIHAKIPVDTLKIDSSHNSHFVSQLPELDIPRLDTDNVWGEGESETSSSDDDEYGELTLVVGRNRTRSIERSSRIPTLVKGHPQPSDSRA